MPGWRIHRKYGELLGIDEGVQRSVDKFIDSRDHHDFYNFFTEEVQTPRLRVFGDKRLVFYRFDPLSFTSSELGRRIEEFGEDGIKCFFLHMFLDIIERNMRYKGSPDILVFEILSGTYRVIFEEVKAFVEENYDRILEDIASEKLRKKDKLGRVEYGMLKGRYKSAVLSTLFRGMTGAVYPYGPKLTYYRRIAKQDIDRFLRELEVRGDYTIFI